MKITFLAIVILCSDNKPDRIFRNKEKNNMNPSDDAPKPPEKYRCLCDDLTGISLKMNHFEQDFNSI